MRNIGWKKRIGLVVVLGGIGLLVFLSRPPEAQVSFGLPTPSVSIPGISVNSGTPGHAPLPAPTPSSGGTTAGQAGPVKAPTAPVPPRPPGVTPVSPYPMVDFGSNLINNGSLESKNNDGGPFGFSSDQSGANSANFAYPAPGRNGGSGLGVAVTSFTSGDAKWYFTDIPAQTGDAYYFSDYYISDAPTLVEAQFTLSSGAHQWKDIVSLPPANDWTAAAGTFEVPAGTVSLTVYQLLQSTGNLRTDDYFLGKMPGSFSRGYVSINFDDGWESAYMNGFPIVKQAGIPATFYIISNALGTKNYMTGAQVLDLQAAGEEIGAHTRTHPHLPTVPDDQKWNEIAGSRADLLALGVRSVTTFAYPYGEYDAITDAMVKQAGFAASRGVVADQNVPGSNPYLLNAYTIDDTTSVAQIEAWINQAVQNKTWAILMFHQIGESNSGVSDAYTSSPENLEQVVNYLKSNQIPVITNAYAVENWKSL